ncbi:MAG: biopolymer transporter ExbD [Rikenellaceae bacterium]|jgi:biopolymer transport protein ExbD|nr:biopolymer transporter ExbD [Rikenellaceae bacterium]
MAVIRKKGKKDVPGYNSSSMSDIIFMLLFFFMITTTMRETEMLVQVRLPEATEIQKLEKKSLASYIYIGSPTASMRRLFGDSPRIQLNDSYKQPWEIGEFIASERDALAEADKPSMTVVLKADEYINMGLVTDVKIELRKAEALLLVYAAVRREHE